MCKTWKNYSEWSRLVVWEINNDFLFRRLSFGNSGFCWRRGIELQGWRLKLIFKLVYNSFTMVGSTAVWRICQKFYSVLQRLTTAKFYNGRMRILGPSFAPGWHNREAKISSWSAGNVLQLWFAVSVLQLFSFTIIINHSREEKEETDLTKEALPLYKLERWEICPGILQILKSSY